MSGTRAALVDAARVRFAVHPYPDVTLREIAADAGVSAALVCKYFGTKDDLLREALAFDDVFAVLLDAPLDRLGAHLVQRLTEHTVDAVDPFLALVLIAVGKDVPAWVRDELVRTFVDLLEPRLDGPDARLRAELVCAYVVGVSAVRRIVKAEPLASTTPAELARRMGPVLQALLDGA